MKLKKIIFEYKTQNIFIKLFINILLFSQIYNNKIIFILKLFK